ncbi:hypothetical protein SDRG_05246 [Saprolegnia diclina VS20]|uniref:Dymeclin n=1 Tax=Saprolegnia diclina (strain VS20) TaxID=1156394 RepID=T0RYK1_SAPDV|nr:hypothetical protein SDRG_05246 [Saprolegnia diclina VS20]EQC37658.1 hypothetical protein SDRG_05246 [Saprolegnia diclina VS20]|eukprot:XP_008609178.1 hypothetical protein SDRG_05246 [Saprolegnia diclina VS20]
MGNSASGGDGAATSLLDAATTSALEKIVSAQPYMMSDDVWTRFFAMDQALLTLPKATLAAFLRPYTHALAANTVVSGNFRMLVRHVTRSLPHFAKPDAARPRHVLGASLANMTNVLVLLRHFCMHFVEHSNVLELFAAQGTAKDLGQSSLLRQASTAPASDVAMELLDALCTVVLEAPPTDETYDLHLECVNTLLTLLSSHAFSATASLLEAFVLHASLETVAKGLVKRVLYSFLDELPPPNLETAASVAALAAQSSAQASWGVLDYFVATETPVFPLADRGVLLLLILLHTAPTEANPFRSAFCELEDRDRNVNAVHAVSYSQLINLLGRSLSTEIGTSLLYALVTIHPTFASAIAQPLDTDFFGLPLLRALYDSTEPTSLFVYCTVLLRLSETPAVLEALHASMLHDHVEWYTEKYMVDISFASAAIVVLVRLLHKNMATFRDPRLHTMAFGTLFNVLQYAHQLHPYASQSLVHAVEHWAKKEARVQADLDGLDASPHEADDVAGHQTKLLEKQAMYMECLHLGLGLINVVLSGRLLPRNPQLMYSLLHASSLVTSLAGHADLAFQTSPDHTHVQEMVAYFRAVVDMEEEAHETDEVHVLSVERVFEYIQLGCKSLFPTNDPRDEPNYCYVFDEDVALARPYFVSMLWALVVELTSDLPWAYDKLRCQRRSAI